MFSLIYVPTILFLVCYVLGVVIKKILRLEDESLFILGFVGLFSIFYIICIPFMLFELNFSMLTLVVKIAFVLILAIGIYYVYMHGKEGVFFAQTKSKRNYINKYQRIIPLLFKAMVIFQIVYIVLYQHMDADDSFYLALSNLYLYQIRIGSTDPASGLTFLSESRQYALLSYEIFLAVLGKIFNLNVAFLAHTVWPIFGIISHYIVIYNFAKMLDPKLKYEFCLIYSFINLFSGYTAYSEGAFLLNRIWQGKAIFVGIYMPLMMLIFYKLYNRKIGINHIIFVTMLLLAGISTTAVAIYLYPILYFILWVGRGVSERKINSMLRLCIPVVVILPLVVTKILLVYNDALSQEAVVNGADDLVWSKQLIDKYLNNHTILLIGFILAVLIIINIANQPTKSIVVYPIIALTLTFANPYAIYFVAKYITGTSVYWRMFWLYEGPIVYAVAAICLLKYCNMFESKMCILAVCISLIISCGVSVFESSNWECAKNIFKLEESTVQIVDMIHEDALGESSVLLLPEEMSYGIRQYCGDIMLIINRYAYRTYCNNGLESEFYELRKNLYEPLYQSKAWDSEKIAEQIKKYHIDYVVLYADAVGNNEEINGSTCIYQNEEYVIYRCKK